MTVFGAGTISLRMYPQQTKDASSAVLGVINEACSALEAGFDGVMFPEHHAMVRPRPYLPNPLQMAGIVLERCGLGWAAACPLILPLRSEVLVAEEVAWLAALHPGRVGLGVAAGYMEADFAVTGGDFDGRVRRFVDQLAVLARIMRGDTGSDPLGADPAIAALNGAPVPFVTAASSRTAAGRAAEHGVGVLIGDRSVVGRHAELTGAFRNAGGGDWCIAMHTETILSDSKPSAADLETSLAGWVAETGATSLSLRLEGGSPKDRATTIETIGGLDRGKIFGTASSAIPTAVP